MQPARRSSRLSKLKHAKNDHPQGSETAPMNTHDIPSRSSSSSRKRLRPRVSAVATSPPPEHTEPEIESLSDEESSDDNPEDPTVAAKTPENRFKEHRYEESRSVYQTKAQYYPELLRPLRLPLTAKFISMAATERVVTGAGLIHTLIDIDPYQPNVVREFIANLLDAKERDDGVAVYVRGSLVDFSPSLINALYCFPEFEEDPNWMDENIDEVMYKLVCSNWIPSTNYTSMNQERLKFVYMLHHHDVFDFGKLVYNQILTMAENTKTKKTRRIMFPTLIQQVLLFQRIIPPDTRDDEFTGLPKLVVKDIKAGRGSGADSSTASLEEDIERTIASLKAIQVRLRRGDYVQYVPHPGFNDDEEEDGDNENEEENGNDSE
ncbi:hypothetical protein F2Q70_00027249 [Brassica cretica]|uniref:Putative plant transposon protein domain-containing protein n=1 Tax=Brassica cretica TaxID=69181 RepID=A0A8S9LB62_BRACR|nr:hypothetical protein F2Q68_00017573 [Brassica cretica]KAF2603207.1 hypothetical protein F2Q70_00027249 [Brassica cretica]